MANQHVAPLHHPKKNNSLICWRTFIDIHTCPALAKWRRIKRNKTKKKKKLDTKLRMHCGGGSLFFLKARTYPWWCPAQQHWTTKRTAGWDCPFWYFFPLFSWVLAVFCFLFYLLQKMFLVGKDKSWNQKNQTKYTRWKSIWITRNTFRENKRDEKDK